MAAFGVAFLHCDTAVAFLHCDTAVDMMFLVSANTIDTLAARNSVVICDTPFLKIDLLAKIIIILAISR